MVAGSISRSAECSIPIVATLSLIVTRPASRVLECTTNVSCVQRERRTATAVESDDDDASWTISDLIMRQQTCQSAAFPSRTSQSKCLNQRFNRMDYYRYVLLRHQAEGGRRRQYLPRSVILVLNCNLSGAAVVIDKATFGPYIPHSEAYGYAHATGSTSGCGDAR